MPLAAWVSTTLPLPLLPSVMADPFLDPALDSCCAKDAQESAARAERNRVMRAEAAKRNLDFAPQRKFAPAQTLGLRADAGAPHSGSAGPVGGSGGDGGGGDGASSDEDLAFLDELDADDDDDDVLVALRNARLSELRSASDARTKAAKAAADPCTPLFGQIAPTSESDLLRLVGASDRVVCLLALAAPGRAASFAADGVSGGGDAALAAGIHAHMQRLTAKWRGTQFVCTALASTDSRALAAVRLTRLPALVCFREGVVADKAAHPHQLRQFVNSMGEIGLTVFEAWLAQSNMLVETPRAASEVRRQAERMRGEHSHGKAPQPSLPLCPRAPKLKG